MLTDSSRPEPTWGPALLPIEPGEIVGNRYEILHRIGKGGMGVVFAARHRELGRRVALKLIQTSHARDKRYAERFDREAKTSGALAHENIATTHDMGCDARGRRFIVMEYIEGVTLRGLISEHGPLPAPRAVNVIRQACRGVAAAHALGILHRDLTPGNIMLARHADGSDWVKILDFGVARSMNDNEAGVLTASGAAVGTPHYMAPEVARGELQLDERVDIYGLGAVLFELLSGERPHPADSYNALICRVAHQPARELSELCPSLPPALCQLVQQTLSLNREGRPRYVSELLDNLEPFDGSSRAHPCIDSDQVTGTASALRSARPEARRATRANLKLAIVASVATALVGLAAGALGLGELSPAIRDSGALSARSARPLIEAALAEQSQAGQLLGSAPLPASSHREHGVARTDAPRQPRPQVADPRPATPHSPPGATTPARASRASTATAPRTAPPPSAPRTSSQDRARPGNPLDLWD